MYSLRSRTYRVSAAGSSGGWPFWPPQHADEAEIQVVPFRELEKQWQRRRGDVRPKVEIAIFRRADVRRCERAQALELEHGVDVGEKRTPALPADGDTRQPRRHGRFDPDAGAFDAVHPIDQRVDTRPPVGGQGVRAEPAALRARRDDGVELV